MFPYGYGEVRDYLGVPLETGSVDWVITNPPFRLGEAFILKSLKVARRGVAMLTRTSIGPMSCAVPLSRAMPA